MQDCWTSFLYAPPKVLGKPLRGLSPFHCLVLTAAHSPYLLGGPVGVADMVLAVHVCSLGWADRGVVLGDQKALQAWGRKHGRADWARVRDALRAYFAAGWTLPQYWPASDARELRADWCWHLATFGMRELGMSEAEAWDCPLVRLAAYRACSNEAQGSRDLMSEDEERGIAVLRAEQRTW